jgi:hypothetical protein
MRLLRIGFALLFVWVAGVVCCVQASEDHTTSSSSSSVVPACANVAVPGSNVACDTCFHRECCAELSACALADDASSADASPGDFSLGTVCLGCFTGDIRGPMCDTVEDLVKRLSVCSAFRCQTECYTPRCVDGQYGPDGNDCSVAPEPDDGGVTAAECSEPDTTIVRGTIDGKPVEETGFRFNGFNQLIRPFSIYLSASASGKIEMFWDDVCLYPDAASVPVTGTVQLPTDGIVRSIKTCSQLLETYDSTSHALVYRFNLLVTGGQITGCAQW